MIQSHRFTEGDFRGTRFADWPRDLRGNNDLLILTQPDAIRDIHLAYFRPARTSWKQTLSLAPPSPRPITA